MPCPEFWIRVVDGFTLVQRIFGFDQDLSVREYTLSELPFSLTHYPGEGLLLHCSFLLVPTIPLLGRRSMAFDLFDQNSQNSELAGFHSG